MLLKLIPALVLLNLSVPAFALDPGEWHVVQVTFNKPLKLGTQRIQFGSSLIVRNVRYFTDGRSLNYVPSFSGYSKDVSQPSDFYFSECMLMTNTQLKEKQTLADKVTAFLGLNDKDVDYKGIASQETSIRVYKEYGVNDPSRQNPRYDAYISVEGGTFHCSSRQPFTQDTLNSIFAGSEVDVKIERPCRQDDIGHGVQKLVCE